MSSSSQNNRDTKHNENNKFGIAKGYRANMPLLLEFHKAYVKQKSNKIKYPMCIYAGKVGNQEGATPDDPQHIVEVMSEVANLWNQELKGWRGFKVNKITFELRAETEEQCNEITDYKPYIIYSDPTLKGKFGGQAKIIRMRVPGVAGIKKGFKKMNETLIHEHGHIIGLWHTDTEGSIMYSPKNGKRKIKTEDIKRMKDVWLSIKAHEENKEWFKD